MIRSLVLGAVAAAVLAGCSDSKNRIAYDGEFFRAKAKKVDKQRDVFEVSVNDPAKSLAGARLAAHHKGVQYCIENYGSSDVAWNADPLDEEAQVTVINGKLIYRGKCPQAQRI